MRFPWQRRADEERVHRMAAEQRYVAAQADWPRVRRMTNSLPDEKSLDVWTRTIRAIFAGSVPPQGRHIR